MSGMIRCPIFKSIFLPLIRCLDLFGFFTTPPPASTR